MSKFQVGDIAVGQFATNPDHNGREVLVTEVRESDYRVLLDGKKYTALPHQLRQPDNPNGLGSWGDCLWKPRGVSVE